MKVNWNLNRPKPDADTLVLLLHGMNCSPMTLSALTDRIQGALPTAELLIPNMPLNPLKCIDLHALSTEISECVAAVLRERKFKSIILMGHSAGGVLVQSFYLDLMEMKEPVPLLGASIRLVLIAPLTRGWTISHHLPLPQKVAWSVGMFFAWAPKFWEWLRAKLSRTTARPLCIVQLQRGSPFTVGLRLRWLAQKSRPMVYTLLGSVDELISWRDMVDEVIEAGGAPQHRVQYIEVPDSNHAEIVDVKDPEYPERGNKRAEAILKAMTEVPAQAGTGTNFEPWDTPPAPVEPDVERVVFVIHGVRDEGHWTQKIASRARQIFEHDNPGRKIRVETSSYGYFSMLEFLRPAARWRKVHWLMDEYVEAIRRFPNAKGHFSYVGHSNGTWLLAQALQEYPAVHFERIAFAGSVVSSRFKWSRFLQCGRVDRVLNFTATGDLVVSLFPRMAEIFPPLRFLVGDNLGGAGVLPFRQGSGVDDNTHVVGGHGAAIREWNWDNLARFAVAAGAPTPPEFPKDTVHYAKSTHWMVGECSGNFITPAILLFCLSLLTAIACLAWMNPALFWLIPVGLLAFGACLAALCAHQAEGRTFSERKKTLGLARNILLGSGALAGLWLIVPGIFLIVSVVSSCEFSSLPYWDSFPDWMSALHSWIQSWPNWLQALPASILEQLGPQQVLGAERMASVAGFLWAVWKVLTKV